LPQPDVRARAAPSTGRPNRSVGPNAPAHYARTMLFNKSKDAEAVKAQ
jgi:hypothetical protein